MKYKLFKLLSFTLLCVVAGYRAGAQNLGFVQQDRIKMPGITTDNQVYPLNLTAKQTTRTYVDGLGRSIQFVAIQASPLQNDLIQPAAYDNVGRQSTSYLPYAGQSSDAMGTYRPNAITTDQPTFYNKASDYLDARDNAPYSQQVFENSPLQRLLLSGMTGSGYQPTVNGNHYKSVVYRANSGSQDGNILLWNPDGTFTPNTYYTENSLSVADGKDEDNVETLSFTDLAGHVVLKRQLLSGTNLDTYYIYNTAGIIRNVIPPKAVTLLAANNYNLAAAPLNTLIFSFVYNTRGQLISKTVPGKGPISIIYDPLNRPVLMQDANMADSNTWNYIKYDAKGRPVSQGIYTDVTYTSPAAMQAYVSGLTAYRAAWFETLGSTLNNNGYYSNNIFPSSNITPLAYAYFGSYTLGGTTFNYIAQGLTNEETATAAQVKGMPTIVCKSTVGLLTGVWLTSVTFYDRNLHPIQTQTNNHVNYGGMLVMTDYKTQVNDFSGVPQLSKVSKQVVAGTTTTVLTSFSYDQVYRLTTVSQQYNNTGVITPVATYSYNELGQLTKKGLGYVNPSSWLQNLDMRYNIRGQLTTINNSTLSNDMGGNNTNGDINDVFGMQMLYDHTDGNLGNTPHYNGKLSAVKWMSKDGSGNNGNERSFVYSYDQTDRYMGETYAERTSASTGAFLVTHGWDETPAYDAGGNIVSMARNSATSLTSGDARQIDNLNYTYSTINPNQLLQVSDAAPNPGGWTNYTGSTGTYTYDANGNLTADPYKGISLIKYNAQNRVQRIDLTYQATGRSVFYSYSRDGTVVRKSVYDNSALVTTTDYVDGFVYITSGTGTPVLSYFPMPEGRVMNNNGTLTQEFIIADQQGNARVSFNNTGAGGTAKVVQENSYYGFGLIMPGTAVTGDDNKNLYNGGSEWQNDYSNLPDYYQTFNRNYDATLGRWIGVDPEAESTESMTPYQYANNNPVLYNDPLGETAGTVQNGVFQQYGPNDGFNGNISGTSSGGYGGSGTVDTPSDESKKTDAQLIQDAQNGDQAAQQEYINRYGTPIYIKAGSSLRDVLNDINNGTNNSYIFVNLNVGFVNSGNGNGSSAKKGRMTSDQYFAVYGAATYSTENLSGISRLGSNLQVYSATERGGVFMGNQFVTTFSIAKGAKIAGYAGALIGTGLDIYGVYKGTTTPAQAGEDGAFTALGVWGGPLGGLYSVGYFGLQAYYPGGASGFAQDYVTAQPNTAIDGWYVPPASL